MQIEQKISQQCPAEVHRKLKIHTVACLWPSCCGQLYRFKMAPGYPGIGQLLSCFSWFRVKTLIRPDELFSRKANSEVPRSADYEYECVWVSRILTRWLSVPRRTCWQNEYEYNLVGRNRVKLTALLLFLSFSEISVTIWTRVENGRAFVECHCAYLKAVLLDGMERDVQLSDELII